MAKIDVLDTQKLKDSTDLLIEEASRCSTSLPRMGVPALITALSVVLTLGEILVLESKTSSSSSSNQPSKSTPLERDCIDAFCDGSMTYEWLVDKNDVKVNPSQLLYEVRNGLAHVLSLPNNIALIPTKEHIGNYPKETIGIIPSLFIEAVRMRCDEIFSQLIKPKVILSNPGNVDRSFIQTDMYEGTVPFDGGGKLK